MKLNLSELSKEIRRIDKHVHRVSCDKIVKIFNKPFQFSGIEEHLTKYETNDGYERLIDYLKFDCMSPQHYSTQLKIDLELAAEIGLFDQLREVVKHVINYEKILDMFCNNTKYKNTPLQMLNAEYIIKDRTYDRFSESNDVILFKNIYTNLEVSLIFKQVLDHTTVMNQIKELLNITGESNYDN